MALFKYIVDITAAIGLVVLFITIVALFLCYVV